MGFVNWDFDDSDGRVGGKTYLNLKSPGSFRIRPLGQPVRFQKYFTKKDGEVRTAITEDEETCEVKVRHPELKANKRYAIYVVDREDGQVKIMEFPKTVFQAFQEWWRNTNIEPGSGQAGFDWSITIKGSGLQTRYQATPIMAVPLTDEEIVAAKAEFSNNPLEDLYKANSSDEIESKLFGDGSTVSAVSAVSQSSGDESGDDLEWST